MRNKIIELNKNEISNISGGLFAEIGGIIGKSLGFGATLSYLTIPYIKAIRLIALSSSPKMSITNLKLSKYGPKFALYSIASFAASYALGLALEKFGEYADKHITNKLF